jgi:hypothetical protein
MKKQPLIILGVILVIVIISLTFYAYQKTQTTTPISQTPPTPTIPTQETKTTNEEKVEKELELEKIKKSIQAIDNENFEIVEEGEEDCEDTTGKVKEYGEDLVEGTATAAEGKVLEIKDNSIIVEFNQATYKWKSEAIINSSTKISTVDSSTQPKSASFSSIVVGDRVALDSGGKKMTDSVFTPRNIYIFK